MSNEQNITFLHTHFPHLFSQPSTLNEIKKLPSFYQDLHQLEALCHQPFGTMDGCLQDEIIQLRLKQLVEICRLNPAWKKRINSTIGNNQIESLDQFRNIPITQKSDFIDLFGGTRKGLVLPLHEGGFLVAASGGTSSGQPSQIFYSLKELQETYQWAGRFIGQHIIEPNLSSDTPKWLGTTLADSQLWSSGTMVGGVLQNVPNINYLGIGPMSEDTFKNIMSYPGEKCLMGISADIAQLIEYSEKLSKSQCEDLKILLYGSGPLTAGIRNKLKNIYPNVKVLGFFAATQAETIGLQLDANKMALTSIAGLHFIEIVKEDGTWAAPGEIGELVITRLFGNAAPILRLNLGDRVRRLPSSSSENMSSICFEYVGRSGDFITINQKNIYLSDLFLHLEDALVKENLPRPSHSASEIQFLFDHKEEKISLLLAVDSPISFNAHLSEVLGTHDIILTEAFPDMRITIHAVAHGADAIHRTSVGKTPFLYHSL